MGEGKCDDGGILWPSENQLQAEDCVHVLITPGLSCIALVCVQTTMQIYYKEHIFK